MFITRSGTCLEWEMEEDWEKAAAGDVTAADLSEPGDSVSAQNAVQRFLTGREHPVPR